MMEDRIRSVGVNQKGYGSIPKMVMLDQDLDIKAKAVYAYFCSYTGAGDSCFPSRSKICGDLKISKDSLSKYMKQLADNGYLVIEQVKEICNKAVWLEHGHVIMTGDSQTVCNAYAESLK